MTSIKKISLILTVYNEERNLPELFIKVYEVLNVLKLPYEIIAVNDGSKDGSLHILKDHALKNPHVKVINFLGNFGQTAALSAGFDHATGEILIPLDTDLENDPADIPRLLDKLEEGYDVVSGWRKDRWSGKFLTRKLPSVLANWLISKITKVKLNDYGCTLKAYRREFISSVKLYGEMHRFIPVYASWGHAKVTQIEVTFTPRKHGKSNYGILRLYRVLLDLILVTFLRKFMNRPIHFFGGLGFVSLVLGFVSGLTAIVLKVMGLRDFVTTPLPILTVFLVIVGFQAIAVGVLAEILMRTYYESQDKKVYKIKEVINM